MISRRQLYAIGEPFGDSCTQSIAHHTTYGGGGGDNTTTQKADPWEGIQPYLEQLYGAGQQWFQSPGPSYYPESTIAGQAPETLAAQQAITERALAGSPLLQQAQENTLATLQGQYLGANPYLDYMYGAATQPLMRQFNEQVMPGVAGQFAAGGRYGSGAQQAALGQASDSLGRALGSTAANIYGTNYEHERQRQQAALMIAPGLAQADYADLQQLLGIGGQRQAYEQALLNADIARWDYGQNQPLQKLQAYNALLQGASPYGTSTSSQSGGGSGLLGALGGASTAYGLAGSAGLLGGGTVAADLGLAAGGAAATELGGAALGAGVLGGPVGWGALALGAMAGSGMFG